MISVSSLWWLSPRCTRLKSSVLHSSRCRFLDGRGLRAAKGRSCSRPCRAGQEKRGSNDGSADRYGAGQGKVEGIGRASHALCRRSECHFNGKPCIELISDPAQPGDRRERLKYVLGQLRQARGEGGQMEVDQGSDDSSDSEDEEVSPA